MSRQPFKRLCYAILVTLGCLGVINSKKTFLINGSFTLNINCPSSIRKNVRTDTMSLTVLQKIIVNGVWSFFSFKIFKSQSKQCNLLFAFTTVKRMLSLLGLTTIGNTCYSSCQCRMQLRNATELASRNAAFPFFPIPLTEKKQHLIRPKLIPSINLLNSTFSLNDYRKSSIKPPSQISPPFSEEES